MRFSNVWATFLVAMIFVSMLAGCGANPEDFVKSGTLQIDQSVTVGDALNGYHFFGSKDWKSFQDSQKRQIVEFNGALNWEKFVGSELQGIQLTADMIKKAKQKLGDIEIAYVAQFAVAKDGETFDLKYSGIKMTGTNKDSGQKMDQDLSDENYLMLQHIYANKPEPSTWGLLVSAGSQ